MRITKSNTGLEKNVSREELAAACEAGGMAAYVARKRGKAA
jgi:hypothetical protein